MASEQDLIEARRKNAAALVSAGLKAFPNTYAADEAKRREALEISKDPARLEKLPGEPEIAADATVYPMFGRLITRRGPFIVLRTPYGDAQCLVRKDELAEQDRVAFESADLGDHVAVEGALMKTKTGAMAVRGKRFVHIGKALLPPPDKWHGLSDVEKRYRERYVDLFANPDVATVFRARALIVSAIRSYYERRGYIEVETPTLHSVRGGATAKPFNTHHNALDLSLFLRIAPELYLKRLLVGGFDRVFEIARCFRNEGISTRHNPEFTMLESYEAYATCDGAMRHAESLVKAVHVAVREAYPQFEANYPFDLNEPFKAVTMRQSIKDRLANTSLPGGVRWKELLTPDAVSDPAALSQAFASAAERLSGEARTKLESIATNGERIVYLFEELVEGDLTKLYRNADGSKSVPVFITEYPFEVSPLARRNDLDPAFVDRFELFVEGREIANAFSELNDPDDQADRFNAQLSNRQRGDEEAMDFDADYIRALSHGMPPAAGFGLGVDRLTMLFTNSESIRDVLFFPLLRPEVPT